ncbi:MAG TPA: GAF domain-containing protein [Candidatus Limnocylindrales bacterium]|nr:GAF domain-containing protein [Candidatus Limnocylindrales bacterium]
METRPIDASNWAAVTAWSGALAAAVRAVQPSGHVDVFIPDPELGALRLAAQVSYAGVASSEAVGTWIVPFEESITGRVYRTGLAALCSDVSMDPDFRAWPGSRTRSSLTVPVGRQGAVLAVVNVEAPWVGAFSIRDYERITDRAAAAALAWPLEPTRA